MNQAQRVAAADASAIRRGLHRAQVAAMLPDKLRALMIEIIITSMRDRGTVTADDLARAGIPRAFAAANFKACLALAKDAAPGIAHNLTAA